MTMGIQLTLWPEFAADEMRTQKQQAYRLVTAIAGGRVVKKWGVVVPRGVKG
jgi:hypothetical protein